MKKSSYPLLILVILIFLFGGIFLWLNCRKALIKDSSTVAELSLSGAGEPLREPINIDLEQMLDIAFYPHPEWWEGPHVNYFGPDEYVSGTRYIIEFHSDDFVYDPTLYIESNDFDLHAPGDAWGLSASDVDLEKTDAEIISRLSFPWTTSMKIQRRLLSGVPGIVLEEEGVDPMEGTDYHRLYYLFPKYNEQQSWNLTMMVDYSDHQRAETFLDTLVFTRPVETSEGSDEQIMGPIKYNCELSGGIFKVDRCICEVENDQKQEDMYDTSTGFCQSTYGGPTGDAFNASVGLPYGEYSYWNQIVFGLCEESGGSISGAACICPSGTIYNKKNGKCE